MKTLLCYQIILKSKNLEVSIDEINNEFIIKKDQINLKISHHIIIFINQIKKLVKTQKYDVIQLTKYSINELFKKKIT